MAFETRYDVSTHVDSSAPADKFPDMCGSATFAIEVSSTSMNVANVTVMAITHGLIFPSGVLSLANILLRMYLDVPPVISFAVSSRYYLTFDPFVLFRDHRRIHVHARP
jgi:hypothetical protein